MAFISKFNFVVLMVVLCLLVTQETSDCSTGYGCIYAEAASQEIQNRKVLGGFEGKKEVLKVGVHGSSSTVNGHENLVGWELRKAPSGPDPLHHNGGSPKKPRTP